jgi:hypothetical protein
LMPVGELVTDPVPDPEFVTVSAYCGGGAGLNAAVTFWFEVRVTVQAPVPEQAPLQPLNTAPAAGVAVRPTAVPEVNEAVHVLPHAIPAGALVTVPLALPILLTVSENLGTNVAVTEVFALTVTTQVPVPAHAEPLHPENTEPAAGVAVSVTLVP